MKREELLAKVDHTLLAPEATWEQIREICDDGLRYRTASVCIPPSYVAQARAYAGEELRICTVIGFPNGYQTTAVKEFETRDAIAAGADEIDMVINIGWLKDRKYGALLEEIRALKKICAESGSPERPVILKVIIETCLLTEEEKIRMCGIVTEAGADYIKTSTGFSKGGATFEDIALFAAHVGPGVKIKAAGGISSFEDAEEFVRLGADRLGTSRLVKIQKAEQQ